MNDPGGEAVYLSVAANLDPEKNIRAAMERLCAQVTLEALSAFYRTAAIGRPEQPDYLNGVARVRTALAPLALKRDVLRPIEAALGRVRTADTCAARPIDLDILLYGAHVLRNDELNIPDPDIAARPFLRAGLLELDPHMVLPGDLRPLAAQAPTGEATDLREDRAFTRRLKEQLHL